MNPHYFIPRRDHPRLCAMCGREENDYQYHFAEVGDIRWSAPSPTEQERAERVATLRVDTNTGAIYGGPTEPIRIEHKQRTSAEAIEGTYKELLDHANGENMELRAEVKRLKAEVEFLNRLDENRS